MVPLLVGVIDAEQLDVVALTFDNVHGVPLNEPDAVSLTNAVHVTV